MMDLALFKKPKLFIETLLFFGVRLKERDALQPVPSYAAWRETHLEVHQRLLVAEMIEKSLASTVWTHRDLETTQPGEHTFYVTNVAIRDMPETQDFWLYVELTERAGDLRTVQLPLHEFFVACTPAGDLTFEDYDA